MAAASPQCSHALPPPFRLTTNTRFSVLPEVRLAVQQQQPGAGTGAGGAVVARGVTVFRVDSLEGEAIGQAIVIDSWGPGPAQ